jgi:hypothetical protein
MDSSRLALVRRVGESRSSRERAIIRARERAGRPHPLYTMRLTLAFDGLAEIRGDTER